MIWETDLQAFSNRALPDFLMPSGLQNTLEPVILWLRSTNKRATA